MSGNYRKEKNCLNCGNEVEFHYCSFCGQPNVQLKEPFWGFIAHSIGHYFHFDSKFFHTLIPLLSQPGQVTLDYLAGKRARYIHPVSLYIFVSIVYFIIVPHSSEENNNKTVAPTEKLEKANAQKVASFNTKLDTSLNGILPGIAKEQIKTQVSLAQFKNLSYPNQVSYVDSLKKLNQLQKNDSLSKVIRRYQSVLNSKTDSTYVSYLNRQKLMPEEARDSWIERWFKKRELETKAEKADGKFNLDAEFDKYKPKQYFLLMPLLAFFIMINFRRNHIYYIDHLVFTIHGMTAYFIISIVTKPIEKYIFGLDSTFSDLIDIAVIGGIIWYLYRGLKLFYNRSRAVTIRKMITLIIIYSFSLAVTEWLIKQIITYLMG
jgi:hypothetical protein